MEKLHEDLSEKKKGSSAIYVIDAEIKTSIGNGDNLCKRPNSMTRGDFRRIIELVCFSVALSSYFCMGKSLGQLETNEAQVHTKISDPQYTSSIWVVVGLVLIFWYFVVISLATVGWWEILIKFGQSKGLPDVDASNLEPVTIIRPCKGIDTEMLTCLESCINQNYPKDKFEVIFCVENPIDPSIPTIRQILSKYPDHQLSLLVGNKDYFGPNPKVNNMSKGYRMAKYDIIWVLDSNVWASPGTLARSVTSLKKSLDNDVPTTKPVILTHHVPLGISINAASASGRLDEMFLFSSHAKFYVGFNKVSIAPCVNGKSNMYRRSNLERAVSLIGEGKKYSALFNDAQVKKFARETMNKRKRQIVSTNCLSATSYSDGNFVEQELNCSQQGQFHAIEFFSTYIGEDNMIGTALWDMLEGRTGMTRDVVVQPMKFGVGDDSWHSYIARRVRWLRVRKYMVLAATLLEPTTESIVIGLMGSCGLHLCVNTPVLPFFIAHMISWCLVDWIQYNTLSSSIRADKVVSALGSQLNNPYFASDTNKRTFTNWLKYWSFRELLALPIWVKAMCGSTIDWRNRPFRIKSDLTAEEL